MRLFKIGSYSFPFCRMGIFFSTPVREGVVIPTKDTGMESSYAVYMGENISLNPRERARVLTGVKMRFPQGSYGRFSSDINCFINRGILAEGLVDVGDKNEVMVNVVNLTDETIDLLKGDRIATLVINKYMNCPNFNTDAVPDINVENFVSVQEMRRSLM